MPGRSGETGDIVVGWLVKLVASLAVVGVLVFDGASLGAAALGVEDQAAAAARAAARELQAGSTDQGAYDAAWEEVAEGSTTVDIPVETFATGPDGSVALTVQRSVPTLVLHYVPGSERWLTVSASSVRAPG